MARLTQAGLAGLIPKLDWPYSIRQLPRPEPSPARRELGPAGAAGKIRQRHPAADAEAAGEVHRVAVARPSERSEQRPTETTLTHRLAALTQPEARQLLVNLVRDR